MRRSGRCRRSAIGNAKVPVAYGGAKLTGELAAAERERDRWASTRETILALAGEHQPEPAAVTRMPVTPAYPQIIEAFTRASGPLRAKDACRALDIDTDARHVEGMRSKLKKLVARGVLTELEAGVFTHHSG